MILVHSLYGHFKRPPYQPPSTAQPNIAPPTMPLGIAHQRSFPLDIAVAKPAPKIPPAILPSEQSLLSNSFLSVDELNPGQGTSTVSSHFLTYPWSFLVPGMYSSLYTFLVQVLLDENPL